MVQPLWGDWFDQFSRKPQKTAQVFFINHLLFIVTETRGQNEFYSSDLFAKGISFSGTLYL